MAFTFQAICDRARVPLNDAAKDRYTDSELLTYAVDAYLLLRRHRPDFFITSFSSLTDYSTLALGDNFPAGVPDEYLPAIADYVTARAEMKDDEHVLAERAQTFFGLFRAGVIGG